MFFELVLCDRNFAYVISLTYKGGTTIYLPLIDEETVSSKTGAPNG